MAAKVYNRSILAFGDDDKVTTTYTYIAFPLGTLREEDGKAYRFCKFDASDVAITANMVVYLETPFTSNLVTADVSDSNANLVFGVVPGACADATWGWVQTAGIATVTTAGNANIVIGDALKATGDGTVDRTAANTAPTNRVVGWATASEAASKVVAVLTLE